MTSHSQETTVPQRLSCFIPSTLAVGETFALNVKVLGEVRVINCANFAWTAGKPKLLGPFNLCQARGIQFLDDVLPHWKGELVIDGGSSLSGPKQVAFDGVSQGAFPGDTRPIRTFGGFHWKTPGIKFIKVIEPSSGVTVSSNAVQVTETPPRHRIVWGDPHWQTFFSDGIRCPEELYAFARDEAFLDFGAISDHMEAVSDRQWEYFQAVSNDYNEPGRFVTLIGQEWTHHKAGHRNIYYRGSGGPVLRSNDPDFDTLPKLWKGLDSFTAGNRQALAIPHHPANVIMGCDWSLGWNPRYEKAIEVYSGWGSSECHESQGNSRPLRHCKGEVEGRHVRDALKLGYRMGFVGGGDIHDGRPGDGMSHLRRVDETYPQGLTAARVTKLTRENIFDAIRDHRTYATTHRRIFFDVRKKVSSTKLAISILGASEDGIRDVVLVRNGKEIEAAHPERDGRIVVATLNTETLSPTESLYARLTTASGDMAWSSPFFD